MPMEKRQAKLKDFQFNSSKCAINSICSTKFWHRNVRYLFHDMCVTLKKVNFKSQNGSWKDCFMYEVWMFPLLFTVYKALRLHIFKIILVVWNVHYILSKFKILNHSADSNLYILSDLPDGIRTGVLILSSVFVPYNVFVSWPLEHLLTFLPEGHVVHKSIFTFQIRIDNFANIPLFS